MRLTKSTLAPSLSLLPLLAIILFQPQSAAGTPTSSSLTKRYCGFDISCPCIPDASAAGLGCTPHFDTCFQVFYWPPACAAAGCGDCVQHCLDPIHCVPPPA
ncbi:hypothetical protein C8F01DRAFT_1230180 [Mycena amicta]|nr:hypothetical protein C8F01DRAFT_1230180 [Mycena amicta]